MAATTPPLSLGEILDRTVQLYRRNFLLLVGISFLPAAVDVLVSGSVGVFISSHISQLQTAPSTEVLLTFFGVLAAFLFVGLPILLAVVSLALNALNYTAFQRNQGQPVTVREAYAYAFRNFWRYFGIFALQLLFAAVLPCAVVAGIAVIGAIVGTLLAATAARPVFAILAVLLSLVLIVALLVVSISIWLRLSLAFPAAVTENTRVWPSIQRSNRLSKGTRGRIFVMYVLVVFLAMVAYYALTVPVDIVLKLTAFKSMEMVALLSKPPMILQVVNLFISFLERALVMPIYAIALLLFYNDQRTRQEGYDIELLMAQAGWSSTPQPSPEAPPPPAATAFPISAPPVPTPSAKAEPASPPLMPETPQESSAESPGLSSHEAPPVTAADAPSQESHLSNSPEITPT